MTVIFSPDTLRQQVEAATGGHVTVLYDDKGYPSYMRRIPKFRYEDLGFDTELGTGVATAFMVGGQEKSEILIGQYQASVYNGRAVSLPGKDPHTNIDWDAAKARCADKGPGWHMMTVHEWAAVALWCKANASQPRGNTDYGRAHDANHEVGLRQDGGDPGDNSGTAGILTGSGPASWRHDASINGIADLVGNIWEWQDLLKMVGGRIHAASDNDYNADEADWTDTGVDMSDLSGDPFNGLAVSGTELTDRLMVTHAGLDFQGSVWTNLSDERVPGRGGYWVSGSDAGLAALHLDYGRSRTLSSIGFRPAFVS